MAIATINAKSIISFRDATRDKSREKFNDINEADKNTFSQD